MLVFEFVYKEKNFIVFVMQKNEVILDMAVKVYKIVRCMGITV